MKMLCSSMSERAKKKKNWPPKKSFTIILSVGEPTPRATAPPPQLDSALGRDAQQADTQRRRAGGNQAHQANGTGADGAAAGQLQPEDNSDATGLVAVDDRHVLTESEVIPDLEANSNKLWTSRFSRGLKSSLAYRFRVYCALNYFGDGCNTFCRARDDQFGHYRCSPTGQKVCLEGWQDDEEGNCLQAKCRPDCQTGQCDSPGTCKCRSGWTGPRCDQCQTYPGCRNGYCLSPGQCLCQQNWGGVLCDQDLNYCSTHEPCKNNATCQNIAPGRYKCNCLEGFAGATCELSASQQQQPVGSAGGAESSSQQQLTAGCALNPCLNGGVCYGFEGASQASGGGGSGRLARRQVHRCQCTSGWTGDYCQWPASQFPPKISVVSSSDDSGAEFNQTDGGSSVEPLIGDEVDGANRTMLVDLQTESSGRSPSTTLFIESPALATATVPSTTTTASSMDMRHLISGVVVASAIGVFFAALLIAWCCLAAFERNGFSFIQMNIIRSASSASSSCSSTAAGQRQATDEAKFGCTLRRLQEKIRNSFRCCPPKRRRHQIGPETKLSIENVLRPPPSYEESNSYQTSKSRADHVSVIVDKRQPLAAAPANAAGRDQDSNGAHLSRAASPDVHKKATCNLVIRGAIEQKLMQASKPKQTTTTPTPSANSRSVDQQMTTMSFGLSPGQLNCPKHGHLYRNRQRQQQQHQMHQQSIRPHLNELDLKVSYPSNEVVIRAGDLYEDHSALR